jgi:hypothetical protein
VALPPVFAILLLLLPIPVAPACQADSSGLSGAKIWSLFVVTLDAAGSWLRSRCVASWVHAMLIVCNPCLSLLFYFSSLFFPLCLSYMLPSFSLSNCYLLNEICAKACSQKN